MKTTRHHTHGSTQTRAPRAAPKPKRTKRRVKPASKSHSSTRPTPTLVQTTYGDDTPGNVSPETRPEPYEADEEGRAHFVGIHAQDAVENTDDADLDDYEGRQERSLEQNHFVPLEEVRPSRRKH